MPQAVYLEFPRSDGSPQKWPVDHSTGKDESNYIHITPKEPLHLKWRTQIGREVAKLLGESEPDKYVFKDFPEGYRFYYHKRGSQNSTGAERTDPYLYGSSSGRYRSPPEFIRHAYWLMTDDTLDRNNCGCKYCSSKKQSTISHDLGLKTAPSTSSAPSSPACAKPKVRLVAQPRRRQALSGIHINHDRTADLRTSRRFRKGELVWCTLSPVIQGEHEIECIDFWPGLVNEVRLKSDVQPHPPREPWRVVQTTVYKIKLLGVMHSSVFLENTLLPYQAYGPSMDLIERLRLVGSPSLLQDRERVSKFSPIAHDAESPGNLQRFAEAATPFALAIQIAAHLVRLWTPTDEWKFQGELPASAFSADGTPSNEVNEIRYQGLWWGAERIWTDDVVRLQPARAQVVPQGSSIIHRASPRADGRGVLLRINSIIAIQDGIGKDARRDCKVAGVLYELAEETYQEDPSTEKVLEIIDSATAEPSIISSAQVISDGLVSPPIASTSEISIGPLAASGIHTTQDDPSQPPLPTGSNGLPYPPTYPLPKPPSGFKFRPIMKNGCEIVLDVSFVSGRYYPELLKHPLLRNTLADVNPDDPRAAQLTALCGLLAGAVNSMECVDWAATRLDMIKHADSTAQRDLSQHWHSHEAEMHD